MAQRILIVDDEAHIVHVLSLKLRNAGYEVLTAMDGEEGLDVASRAPSLDLIITDFQMPYMTGLELCRRLLDLPHTAKIPVLMLTARGYALDEHDLNREGFSMIRSVMNKPFSPRAIVEVIQSILAESVGTDGPAGNSPRRTAGAAMLAANVRSDGSGGVRGVQSQEPA